MFGYISVKRTALIKSDRKAPHLRWKTTETPLILTI